MREHALMGQFLRDASRYPRLAAHEERALSTAGDTRAVHRLVECNLRLVVYVIRRRFLHWDHPIEDMVQDGNIALLHCARTYDGSRGFRFATYAVPAIHRAILQGVWAGFGPLRIPDRVIAAYKSGKLPDTDPPWSIRTVRGDVAVNMVDALQACDIDEELEHRTLQRAIARALKTLPTRDQAVVATVYGLCGHRQRRSVDVARRCHITPTRVGQIVRAFERAQRVSGELIDYWQEE